MTMRPPRILLAYNTSWYVWNFRMSLIRAKRARGCEVVVVAPRDAYTDRIIAEGIGFRGIALRASCWKRFWPT